LKKKYLREKRDPGFNIVPGASVNVQISSVLADRHNRCYSKLNLHAKRKTMLSSHFKQRHGARKQHFSW